MAESVAGRAPQLNGPGSPASEATLTTPAATASNEHEHNDDVLANLHHCVLEQCRALLIRSRSVDRRPYTSDEAANGPVPSSHELSKSAYKQDEGGVRFTQRSSSDSTLDDIAARIYLWGDVVNTGRAQATSTLSPDLHRTIMEVLVECAKDTKRLMKVCSAETDASAARSSIVELSELDLWLEKASYILDIGETTEQSDLETETESHESNNPPSNGSITATQDILESLDESVTLLMSLLPAIDHLSSLKCHVPLDQPSVSLFEVSDPAKLWVSQVRDKYPDAPRALAERLGESNWQRFCRLRIPQDETFAEELGQAKSVFHAPRQAISAFHDSALGSSLATLSDDVKSNASHSSFASSANNSSKYQNRVPPEPPEVAAEKPFTCSVCLQNITRVRSGVDWKLHVFNDLRPYVCLDIECRDLLTTFASRKAWAQHDLDSHAQYKTFECHDCDYSCQIECLFDEHISSHHSQLNSKQRTALVAAAARYQHSNPDHRACPLCVRPVVGTFREFTTHVCRHMEDLALGTLPRHMYNDDGDDDDDLASDGSEDLPSLPSLREQASDEYVEAAISPLPASRTSSPRSKSIEVSTSPFGGNDAKQKHIIHTAPEIDAQFSPGSSAFRRSILILHADNSQSGKHFTAQLDTASASSFVFTKVVEALRLGYVPTKTMNEFQPADSLQNKALGRCKLFFKFLFTENISSVDAYVVDMPEYLSRDFDLLLGCDYLVPSGILKIGNEGDGAANNEPEAGNPLPRLISEDEPPEINLQEDEPVQQVEEGYAGHSALVKTQFKYDDGLTEEEWLAAVDDSDDSVIDAVKRKQARIDKRKANKAKREAEGLTSLSESSRESSVVFASDMIMGKMKSAPPNMGATSTRSANRADNAIVAAHSCNSSLIGSASPLAFGSRRRRDVNESTRNDLLWEANTQENLAELASKGDARGVASILSILERAETGAVIAAAKAGHEEILLLLIAMGRPDPDPHPIRVPGTMPGYNTPILATIGQGHPEVVKLLSSQAGFNPTRTYRKLTYYELAEERKGEKWEEEYNILKQAYDKYATLRGQDSISLRRERKRSLSKSSKPPYEDHLPDTPTVSDEHSHLARVNISPFSPPTTSAARPRNRYSCNNCRNIYRACVYQDASEVCEQCIKQNSNCGPKVDSIGRLNPDTVSIDSPDKPALTAHSPENPGASAVTDLQHLSDNTHT